MPKARFSSLDVAAIVSSLRSTVLGYRISNVYDINPRTYLLKLAKAGDDAKLFVLIESGVRVHLTTYERDKAQIPSNFTLKLRKHVRTRRIEKVEQLGADRASARGTGLGLGLGLWNRAALLVPQLWASAAPRSPEERPSSGTAWCRGRRHPNPNPNPHPSPNPHPHPHPHPGVIVIT